MTLVYALLIIVQIIGVLIGLNFIIKSATSKSGANTYNGVDIVNSYENTEQLIQKFPVNNPTTVEPGLETNIQNRLLTGFENWNRGFEAWKAWGNILYTKDSIYNVHGCRLTLKQYQDAMNESLQKVNILMGAFHNMLICGEFCAIHYDFTTIVGETSIPGKVMEFVKFKDYGEELGTRVVEGWGSTRDSSYDGMAKYQGEKEKEYEDQQQQYMINYQIPETDDLHKKYPILYPTEYKDSNAKEILEIILKGFDSWNQGINSYLEWVSQAYDENATSSGLDDKPRTMEKYKEEMTTLTNEETIKKIYFDNILIRENWAALHYRYTREKDSVKTAGDRMQFLKLEQKENGLKIVASWIQ